MRASLGFHVVALCFISSSLIWVNADWEEWSTWSGCSQNISCQSNDVIITSNRTRCCNVTKDDSSIYLQDCKGPNIEIRTCECGEKYNEEAAPIQNTDNRVIGDQVVSRLMRVQGVHEHANSPSNEVGSRRSSTANQLLVANSRKPRAADLLSFLAKQPAISETGGPKQKENYISDYMQLHDLADTKNMSGIKDGHSQYLKSFKDFLQKVPNEDIIKQELDQLNDVLLLRGPTVPVKENVSVVKPTSPLSVAVDTTTKVDLGTEVPVTILDYTRSLTSVTLPSQDVSTALASQQPQEASNGEAGEQEGEKDNEEKEPPSEDFLKLVEDIGASPDEVDAQHIDKIANFMDTLKETTDEEKLSENINFWNEKLKAGQHSEGSSTEVGASLKTTTMPTKLSGEDLLFSLINRIGPTQESEMRDLGPLLDEMNKLSSNEVSGEELDQINELLNVVKEEDILTTTEATAPTAGSTSNLIADGAYLLQLLNNTERIDQTQLKHEFKDDFVVLNRLLETSNRQPSKDIQDILDKISDLVNARTTIKMTEYSTTIPATITTHIGSTLVDGADHLNMIQELPDNKKKQNEENQLQVQHMEDLFSDIREQNKDVLSQEIIHMKQLLNPSNVSRDISAAMFVTTSGEATTAPSTMVAKEKVLDFVGEIAGLAMNEDMNNKQQMEDINDIFERVKESDGDVLPNEVHQLLGLLSHSTVATTTGMAHITGGVKESTAPLETTEPSLQQVPGTATAAPPTSTATTAPSKGKVLDFVEEIAGLTGNEQLINQKEMEGINDILQNVQESDRDVLKNEVHQLLGLLVASTLESTTLKASSIASYDTLASNTLPASTTAAYERATKGDGETLLETIEEFKATNEEYEKEDRIQVQGLEKIFDDVEESNQDVLYHEINHLNQLLNPTAIPVQTSPVEKAILHSTILTKENATVLVEEFKTHMRTEEFATTPYAVVTKEDMLDLLDEISVLAGKDKTKSKQEVQDIQDVLEGVHELDEDVLADEIKHLKGLLSNGGVSTTQKPHLPTIVSSTEGFATTPYAVVTKEDMLDLLDEISVLAGKDETQSRQEVHDIQDVLEGVHELDEDVLVDEIKHLKGLIVSGGVSTTQKPHMPTIVSATEEFATTPYAVVGKEGMLELLDEISILAGKDKTKSRQDVHDIQDVLEGVHELDEDILVDEIKHLKGLILSGGVSTTQKPHLPTIVSSTAEFATMPYAVVTKEDMLDLLDEISVLAGKDETQSRQEVHDIQDVLEGVHELDEDVLADEIKHLKGLLSNGGVSTTQKPHLPTIVSSTAEFATTPYAVVTKEDMLDLLDEISVLAGKDKTESRQDVHDIQDVLEGVHELDEDVLVDEIKHLKGLILSGGVSTTQKPHLPTIVSATEEFATTPYAVVGKEGMLELLDEISILAGKDKTKSRQDVHDIQDVLEGVHELDEDVLVDEIKHLQGLILSGGVSTTQKPHLPTIVSSTAEFATMPYAVVTKEDMLDLLDEISVLAGKDETQSRQEVHDIQDVLEGVHELDEDVLVDEIKHLQGLIMGGGVSTTQRPHMPTIVSTTEEFATTPYAAVTKEDMLDLLDEISVLAGKDKTESRQEVQDIQDVLEGVHELDEDVLVDEIKHLKGLIVSGGVSTTQKPHMPTIVSSTEEFATRPYAVVTKEDMLDLLDEISVLAGKDKTESRQKVHDIQDVLEGVHELDKNVLVDEIKHLQCLILSGGVISTTQTPHLPTPVSATSTASEVVTFKEISTITSHTYHQRTSPCKPPLQPTIVGKYVLDFLQKVENISQNRLKSDFEDDVNLVDQFVKANNLNVGEDLGAVISHIGAFLSRNISSKTPFILGVKTVSPIVTSKGSPLVSAIPPLPSTVTVAINQEPTTVPTELVHEPLLDLIETLGKASTVGGHENRLEVQRLQAIWAEEGKLQENILGDELDHLNKVLNPEKYTTKMTPLNPLAVSPSPWQREVQISSSIPIEGGVKLTTVTVPRATSPLEEHITLHQTPFAGENLLELFDEVPEGSRTELQKNKEGMEVFGDVLKGVKESDEDFVNNEVDQLIAMLLPVEAVGTALGPLHATTPALWTAVGQPVVTEKEPGIFEKGETQFTTSAGHPQPTVMTVPLQQGAAKSTLSKAYDVSEVTEMPENKNNQVLLDILSGPLMLDSDLVQDAAGMQGIAELFTNLTQTDEEMYINEIAQLDHGLHRGVETTLAYQMSTEPTEQNVLTKLTTKGLVGKLHSLFPSTRTTVTSSTSRGYGKDFLDTLRQLGDQTNEGIDWEDINRLGELSEGHLDTEDREGLKDGLEFVSKLQKEDRASTTTFRHMYSATTKKMTSVTAKPTKTTPTTTEIKTATPVPSQVAIQTAEETFLDTMRELVAGVNLNLPWVQIKRVGALSETLDKNASKEVEDELRWTDNVADIVNEVGKLENRTPGTTHVPSAATTATTAASTTLSPVIETSVAKQTTTEVSTPPLATTPYSPVDRWTEWSPWGDCSSTCGLGEQSRSRECRLFIEGLIIPSSSCEGSRAETMVCETRRCPETPRVDGQWSGWSVWTECSAMCGPGKQTRYRVCDSPQPAGNDGLPCEGSMTDEQDCVGQADVCEETGVKASTSSTPRSQVIKPARQPVNKTVPIIVLVVFIVVVALAFVACFTVKLRRVYGKKRYRGGKPIFENDTLVSSLQSHAP